MFKRLKDKFVNSMADKVAAKLGIAMPAAGGKKGKAIIPQIVGYGSAVYRKTLSDAEAQNLLSLSFQKPLQSLSFNTVNPGTKGFAQDSLGPAIKAPDIYGLEGVQQDIIYTFFAKYGFIGYQACALLAQHWLIDNACTIPNEDALRPGWKTELIDEEEKEETADLLQKLSNIETKKYDIFAKALKWGRNRKIFGIALAYPIIDGIDTEQPFNIDGVKPGSFKGIAIIDPYWCMPEFSTESVRNPLDSDYFKPTYYVFNGRRIHRSHLLIWLNDEPSDILKPSYIYGGIPLTQMIYERVYAAEKSANEAPEILLTKRSTIAKSDDITNALLNEAETAKKLTWMRKLLNNFGIWLTEYDVHQLDTTLTGLTEIIDNQYKLVAAVAKVSEHKLMKTNPSGGIGNTGEFSTKDYRLEVCSLQEHGFKPFIERIEDIILRSELNCKSQTDITFNELDLTDESERTALQNQKAERLAKYLQNGIISPDEARQSVIKDKNSGLGWLPEDTPPDLLTNEQEQELTALMDKGGSNGPKGGLMQAKATEQGKAEDGGEGSGNFGHAGRPGQVGGSQKEDERNENKTKAENKKKEPIFKRFTEENKTIAENIVKKGFSSLSQLERTVAYSNGIVEETAETYLKKYTEHEQSEKAKIRQQVVKQIKEAIFNIKEGEEIKIKNIRPDLRNYGSNGDIVIKYGNHNYETKKGGGALHIRVKHAEDIDGIVDTILDGDINRWEKETGSLILTNGKYKVILRLTDNGIKKTWLLTGYEMNEEEREKEEKHKVELASGDQN